MNKFKFEDIAINSTAKKKPVEEDKYTYLGLEHLDKGTLKITRVGSEIAPIGEKLLMKKGDVLFGKRRAYQKKVAIAPFDGIFSAHGMVLRPKEEVVNKSFFPLFISSDYFLDEAIKISVGSLSPTINWRDLRILEFSLPTLEEQEEYAKLLWSINDVIEGYKTLIEKTDEILKSYIFDFTKEQDKMIKIKNCCKFEKKSGLKAQLGKDEGKYPFYTSSPVLNKWSDEKTYDGTYIILGTGGSASIHCTDGKFSTSNDNFIIRSVDDNIKTEYIYMYLSANIDILENGFIGSGLKHISKTYVNSILIPIISIEEQNKLIKLFKTGKKAKENLQIALKDLRASYNNILSDIFNK